MKTRIKNLGLPEEISIEDLINSLPENIFCDKKRVKAFLEITGGHVYYCTKHDTRGNLNCVFVSVGKGLLDNLVTAHEWIKSGKDSGDIISV